MLLQFIFTLEPIYFYFRKRGGEGERERGREGERERERERREEIVRATRDATETIDVS
jgi:hypothetical protein